MFAKILFVQSLDLPIIKFCEKSKIGVLICLFIHRWIHEVKIQNHSYYGSIVKLDFEILIETFVTGLSIDQRDILNEVEIMTVVNIP